MRKPASYDVDHEKQDVVNKGAWSKQEDQKLIDYIHTHGEGCWRTLPQTAGLLRCGKSCRLRWTNYLRPNLKRGNFGEDEDDLIIKLHALLGNRWSLIAGRLPGRTDNEVKNYWNSHLKRKLINKGIDPNSHRLHSLRPPMHNHAAAISDESTSLRCNISSHGKLNHHIEKTPVRVNINDEISDAASCLSGAGNYCADLPDLNLEFAM